MSKQDKEAWIKETQMFQRIAGVKEETTEELGKVYDDDQYRKLGSRKRKKEQKNV